MGSARLTSWRDNEGQAASWLSSQLQRQTSRNQYLNTKPTFACIQTTTTHSHTVVSFQGAGGEQEEVSARKMRTGENHEHGTYDLLRSYCSESYFTKHLQIAEIKHSEKASLFVLKS
jgi:hypothetical protein